LTPVVRARATDTLIVVPDLGAARVKLAERILLTALLIAFGIVAYLVLVPVVDGIGTVIWGTVASFLGIYTVLGLVALWVSWRPAPRRAAQGPTVREVVIGGSVVRVPEASSTPPA
jgi:hypothetical protein